CVKDLTCIVHSTVRSLRHLDETGASQSTSKGMKVQSAHPFSLGSPACAGCLIHSAILCSLPAILFSMVPRWKSN
ncbi:hypothetical protein M514_00588, partial [Trichuris suis]